MDLRPLDGMSAIVTGGGRGLGRAMALGLARAGARVIATAAREATELEAVELAARAYPGEPVVLPMLADVTAERDCDRVVQAALERFGRLDILVNNAGRGMKYVDENFMDGAARFWNAPVPAWRLIMDVNVNGSFLMARCATPVMMRAGWGRIVNISMNHETMRRPGFSPYGPSKAALESATLIWAQELDGTGVTVNALLPGGASRTGMIPDKVPEQVRARLLDPAIMVPPLLWLASREADGCTGRRLVASRWRTDLGGMEAAEQAMESAGWP